MGQFARRSEQPEEYGPPRPANPNAERVMIDPDLAHQMNTAYAAQRKTFETRVALIRSVTSGTVVEGTGATTPPTSELPQEWE